MTKRTSAKYKLDRRMGENVFGRPKSPVNRREYGPGQHGQRRKSKISDFGIQLRAKQKLKGYYGDITEKQFKKNYTQASAMKGDASQNLIGLLERRLDMVVYRAKFAPTIWAARQLVSHGHVRVNGVKCNIASRRVERRRRGRARPQGAGNGARGRSAGSRRARHPRLRGSGRHWRRSPTPECPSSTRCPIRYGWNRTSWSSSTRAKLDANSEKGRTVLAEPPFSYRLAPDGSVQQLADLGEHRDPRIGVVELVIEAAECRRYRRIAGLLSAAIMAWL